jgi:hypothetical protein
MVLTLQLGEYSDESFCIRCLRLCSRVLSGFPSKRRPSKRRPSVAYQRAAEQKQQCLAGDGQPAAPQHSPRWWRGAASKKSEVQVCHHVHQRLMCSMYVYAGFVLSSVARGESTHAACCHHPLVQLHPLVILPMHATRSLLPLLLGPCPLRACCFHCLLRCRGCPCSCPLVLQPAGVNHRVSGYTS